MASIDVQTASFILVRTLQKSLRVARQPPKNGQIKKVANESDFVVTLIPTVFDCIDSSLPSKLIKIYVDTQQFLSRVWYLRV